MSLRTFAGQALSEFQTTAAIAPSSRYLVRGMLAPLSVSHVRTVVELGPGTGPMTQALLDVLSPQARLFAFEVNRRFYRHLKENFKDPRLVPVLAGAETLDSELQRRGCHRVDFVVSSLGLTLMSREQRHAIFHALVPFLHEKSVVTQFQYLHMRLPLVNRKRNGRYDVEHLLRRYFRTVHRKCIWRNLPPACIYTCRR